jgi:NADH-quinone oxidoreductase subunit N
MTIDDIFLLLPLIVLAATALIVMLSIAFYRCHVFSALLTLFGIVASFGALMRAYSFLPHQITTLLIFDKYAFFYVALILAASFIVVVLSYGYLKKREGSHEEFYVLFLLAILGSGVLITASHFASLFLGLEILSVSLYTLIAYLRFSNNGIEAGIKYLILASASAAFLLFGMALIYAELGTMSLSQVAAKVLESHNMVVDAGTAMIIVGIGFKLALVPFHMWTPDVYEGAPAPVTAFIATVSKGAVFALLLRYFTIIDVRLDSPLFLIFTLIAVASMSFGNILALMQNNIKRILAYSSIAHLGYLLVAFLASRIYAFTAVSFYLVAYFVTTLGAFGIITVLSGSQEEADSIDDYKGMATKRPWLSAVFIAMLLSLAGIPLTAGFIGKFYIVKAGIGSSLWLLVFTLAINSAMGLFYYLRIAIALFMHNDTYDVSGGSVTAQRISMADGTALGVLSFLLVWLGVYPGMIIDIIHTVAGQIPL